MASEEIAEWITRVQSVATTVCACCVCVDVLCCAVCAGMDVCVWMHVRSLWAYIFVSHLARALCISDV